jgi:hypothetical protein
MLPMHRCSLALRLGSMAFSAPSPLVSLDWLAGCSDVTRKDEKHRSLHYSRRKQNKGGMTRGKWRVWGVRGTGGRIPPFPSGPGASLDPRPPKPSIPSIPSTPSITQEENKTKGGGAVVNGGYGGFEGPEAGYHRSPRDPVPLSTHGPQNHQYPPYPPLPPILKKKTKKGGGRSLGKWRVWIVWRGRRGPEGPEAPGCWMRPCASGASGPS